MDKSAKDARHVACVALNLSISQHARRKELSPALAIFTAATQSDGANTHTFAAIINCAVRCGEVATATRIFEQMKGYKKGIVPDVVIYTTLIKGHCEGGNLPQALALFAEMSGAVISTSQPAPTPAPALALALAAGPKQPPKCPATTIPPNIRTINTLMRGCVLVGAIAAADALVVLMQVRRAHVF